MHLFYSPVVIQGPHLLDEQESWHCTRVLRLSEGGTIHLDVETCMNVIS